MRSLLATTDFDKDVERITSAKVAMETTVLVLSKASLRRMNESPALKKLWKGFRTSVLNQRNLVKYCMLRKVRSISYQTALSVALGGAPNVLTHGGPGCRHLAVGLARCRSLRI
jgi:hypothetical protein